MMQREFLGRVGLLLSLALLLGLLSLPVRAEEAGDYAWSLWTGTRFRFDRADGLDLSGEYQVRLDDDFRNLNSHFLEALAFGRLSKRLELAGGYRFTLRPDWTAHRLVALAWWDMAVLKGRFDSDRPKLTLTPHAGYQRDFNVSFNDRLIQSNSVRYLLTLHIPVSRELEPFIRAGALATWNEEFNFGLDRLRFILGLNVLRAPRDRIVVQYMFEETRSLEPEKHSHVIWIRYLAFVR
jgi:hypothetical protein